MLNCVVFVVSGILFAAPSGGKFEHGSSTAVDKLPVVECTFDDFLSKSLSVSSAAQRKSEERVKHTDHFGSLCHAWRNSVFNSRLVRWRVFGKEGITNRFSFSKWESNQLGYGAEGDAGYLYVDDAVIRLTPLNDARPVTLETKSVLPAHVEAVCFRFRYHLFGADVKRLALHHIDVSSDVKTLLWSRSGSQGRQWHRANVTLSEKHPYRLQFEAILPERTASTSNAKKRAWYGLDRLEAKWGRCREERHRGLIAAYNQHAFSMRHFSDARHTSLNEPTLQKTRQPTTTAIDEKKTVHERRLCRPSSLTVMIIVGIASTLVIILIKKNRGSMCFYPMPIPIGISNLQYSDVMSKFGDSRSHHNLPRDLPEKVNVRAIVIRTQPGVDQQRSPPVA